MDMDVCVCVYTDFCVCVQMCVCVSTPMGGYDGWTYVWIWMFFGVCEYQSVCVQMCVCDRTNYVDMIGGYMDGYVRVRV